MGRLRYATANPSTYLAQNVELETFLQTYAKQEGIFLSGEVIADTAEEMIAQAEQIGKIDRAYRHQNQLFRAGADGV